MTVRTAPLALVLLVACGGDVVDQRAAAGGVGGGATTSAATTNGSATATTTTATGGPAVCGGKAGIKCAAGQFCDYAGDDCGGFDDTGDCVPMPEGCFDDCPGVCGCDGAFYCNACNAQQAGVDVSTSTSCIDADYSAYLWLGGLDHLVLAKAIPAQGVCVLLYADAPNDGVPGYAVDMPVPWNASNAIATNDVASCSAAMPPSGDIVSATGATGVIAWTVGPGMYYPCTLDITASVTFPAGTPWLPETVDLAASMLTVEGGCL